MTTEIHAEGHQTEWLVRTTISGDSFVLGRGLAATVEIAMQRAKATVGFYHQAMADIHRSMAEFDHLPADARAERRAIRLASLQTILPQLAERA